MLSFTKAKDELENFINRHPDKVGNIEKVQAILADITAIADKTQLPAQQKSKNQLRNIK